MPLGSSYAAQLVVVLLQRPASAAKGVSCVVVVALEVGAVASLAPHGLQNRKKCPTFDLGFLIDLRGNEEEDPVMVPTAKHDGD